MRDWTKAMAALLAAISSVALAQATPAQATPAQATPAQATSAQATPAQATPAQDATAAKPAVKANDDPFAQAAGKPGEDLTQGEMKVSDLNSIDLRVSDANLVDVLRSLAEKTRKNIIT